MAPIPLPKIFSGPLSPEKRARFKHGTASPSTPNRSPIKKRKAGISLQQKQALVDNLRLEITERARRLRAQYHLQAQGLKSRIEIRINRIPMALRKLKMEDLLLKYADQEQHDQRQQLATTRAQPPPVPAKDVFARISPQKPTQAAVRTQNSARPPKQLSNVIVSDKENDVELGEHTKKRVLGNDGASVDPAQVLSPTSSNSRLANRERTASPIKGFITKGSSPIKPHGVVRPAVATNVLSSMVEKAKKNRTGGTRKVTTASISSSTSSGTTTTASARTKRAATAVPRAPGSRSTTRQTRRASSNSETSEGSSNSMAKKPGTKSATAAPKRAVAGPKKGAIGEGKSSEVGKVKSATGRMLRKRA